MFVAAHSFKANLKTSSLHKLFLEVNGPSIRGHPASWSTPEFQLKNSALELTYIVLRSSNFALGGALETLEYS